VDADRSQADDEVIDEDGNVVEPSKEGLLDAKLELTAQAYVAYYRNLSLELGAALLGAVALCVCVVVSDTPPHPPQTLYTRRWVAKRKQSRVRAKATANCLHVCVSLNKL
jgi:hypothetical protein